MLFTAFNTFMSDLYGDRHYKERIREYCSHNNIQVNSTGILWGTQELEHGGICVFTIIYNRECELSPKGSSRFPAIASPGKRRKVTRNFDWDSLYECCQLFRSFYDGTEYYYYPELFLIATNLCNVEKGKRVFMDILNSPQNLQYMAYHERNWSVTLNTIIKSDYQPQSCDRCQYADSCNHLKNMILTATGYGLGTLWIANTCFAYNELMDFIGTDSQLTGIVAVGFADEAPDKRPRKPFEEIVEYR